MLKEFKKVSQEAEGRNRRRWFSGKSIELLVWLGIEENELIGFQLCYDLQSTPHAFTWQKENNLLIHEKIDEGDNLPRKNLAPIMVSDGVPPIIRVKEEFERESLDVDAEIRDLVLRVFNENYP